MKTFTQTIKTITLAIILSVGISYVSAWTAPTATPPGGNTSAPINVGSTAQTKSGALNIIGSPISANTELGSYGVSGASSGVGYVTVGRGGSNGGGFVGWDYTNHGIALNAHGSGGSVGGIFVKSASAGSSNVGIGMVNPSYRLAVAGDILASNAWLRTTGDTGWHSDTYGGGWHMTDTAWIRAYNDKGVYTPGEMQAGTIRGNSSVCIGSVCKSSWPAGPATYNCNSVTYGGWGVCLNVPCGTGYTNTTEANCSEYSTCWGDGSHDTGNWYHCAAN